MSRVCVRTPQGSLLAVALCLGACTGHWDTLRYYSEATGEPVAGADYRLDVGYSHLSELDSGDDKNKRLRELLQEQVVMHGECEGGQLQNYRYGCLEGCGVYYVTASCASGDDKPIN